MIKLGLERIVKLLSGVQFHWKAIHVAGTNGKGSVCAYLSAMLHGADVRAGRFTSPHLIDKWDCITINEKPVSETIFRRIEEQVKQKNSSESIDASEFEILTATAFHIFNEEKVKVAVIECGMGGKFDSTNIISDPLVTVITSIAMDHQGMLGNTIEEIAEQKAGIIKQGVPCVVNPTMDATALATIRATASSMDASLVAPTEGSITQNGQPSFCDWQQELLEHKIKPRTVVQASNMWTALKILQIALPRLESSATDIEPLLQRMSQTSLPGRLQEVSIESITGRKHPVLLDGAHNPQAFRALANYVNESMRSGAAPVTWLLAMSKGKDADEMFSYIERGDTVVTTRFGIVDGMPWVKAAAPCDFAFLEQKGVHLKAVGEVRQAMIEATQLARDGPLVIAGSLYLISDVLRLLRDS